VLRFEVCPFRQYEDHFIALVQLILTPHFTPDTLKFRCTGLHIPKLTSLKISFAPDNNSLDYFCLNTPNKIRISASPPISRSFEKSCGFCFSLMQK